MWWKGSISFCLYQRKQVIQEDINNYVLYKETIPDYTCHFEGIEQASQEHNRAMILLGQLGEDFRRQWSLS